MLAEMEAYAAQALKIDSLERQVKALQGELEAIKIVTLPKEEVKSWFSTISDQYAFLTDKGKELAYIALGEK